MAFVNVVHLIGNLTRDVEIRHVSGDNAVGNFGLAINRKWTNKSGEKMEEVTFLDCEAWGRTAETIAQYVRKGSPLYVQGRLKMDEWQDKESGQKRTKIKVVVEQFQFMGSGDGGKSKAAPVRESVPPADEDCPF